MTPAVAGLLGAAPPLAFAVFSWMTPAIAHVTGYERLAWIAMAITGLAQVARLRDSAGRSRSAARSGVPAVGGPGLGE